MNIEAQVRHLLNTSAREGLALDWKEGLPTDRTEFLADVTSFANTSGGLLVFCVAEERVDGEKTGRPGEVTPVDPQTAQGAQERCANWLADAVQPRIPIADVHVIDAEELGLESGSLVVVHIERSWTGPHMVSREKGRWSMYKRNTYGKRPLDPNEIAAAFSETASIPDRVHMLRQDGIARLEQELVPRQQASAALLQVAPLGWWQDTRLVDYAHHARADLCDTLTGGVYRKRLNIDGLFVLRAPDEDGGGSSAYTQFYRTGTAEYVDTYPFYEAKPGDQMVSYLATEILRPGLATTLFNYGALVESAGIAEPIVVALTLHEVDGFALTAGRQYARNRFDRRTVPIPAVTVDKLDERTIDHLVVDLMTDVYLAAGEATVPYKYADATDEG